MRMQVQAEMTAGHWDEDILELPQCAVGVDEDGEMIWNGPRVRMGICEGSPESLSPHKTSGRADYFGKVVNRYISMSQQLVCPGLGAFVLQVHVALLTCSHATGYQFRCGL